MNRNETIKRLQVLFRRLSGELKKGIDETKCNNYIQDLEEIKESLYKFDYYWIEDFDVIEEVSAGLFSDEAPEEIIQDAVDSVRIQSERLLEKLGMDLKDILA